MSNNIIICVILHLSAPVLFLMLRTSYIHVLTCHLAPLKCKVELSSALCDLFEPKGQCSAPYRNQIRKVNSVLLPYYVWSCHCVCFSFSMKFLTSQICITVFTPASRFTEAISWWERERSPPFELPLATGITLYNNILSQLFAAL